MVGQGTATLLRFAAKYLPPVNINRGFKSLIDIHPAVQRSLQQGDAVVALESTIITHGMPYPQNLKTAVEVEQLVTENGAIPATIAIINGRIKVGLNQEEMKELSSTSSQNEVIKCSRRDLPYLVANKKSGGTTVAATICIAHMIGIDIFATGGMGGVHRDGHLTMDISADLVELGRTPVTVVSSGIKSILDIPRTLEYLETQGVCVATYQVENLAFPDFYTRESNCKAPYNLKGPKDAANLIYSLKELNLKSGILIGVPIPERFAVGKNVIEKAINEAICEAQVQGISGKQVTPYLLAAIANITKGCSLDANIALIKNNANTASQIARELCKKYNNKNYSYMMNGTCDNKQSSPEAATMAPLVIGASVLDLSLTMLDEIPSTLDGASYRAKPMESAGGVGHNIAEGIFKLFGSTNFISLVGNDHLGSMLLKMMPKQIQHAIKVDDMYETSLFTLLIDKAGECKIVVGNMDIHENITPEMIEKQEEHIRTAPIIIMDSNISLIAMERILQLSKKHEKPVFFEPTDMRIAHKPFSLPRTITNQIKLISPNIYELYAIIEAITKSTPYIVSKYKNSNITSITLEEIRNLLLLVNNYFDCIILTLGEQGVVVSSNGNIAASGAPLFDVKTKRYFQISESKHDTHAIRFYAAPKVNNIKNASGAGDSFTSGYITALLRGYDMRSCVALGFLSAEKALQSISAVPEYYFKDDAEESAKLQFLLNNIKEVIL